MRMRGRQRWREHAHDKRLSGIHSRTHLRDYLNEFLIAVPSRSSLIDRRRRIAVLWLYELASERRRPPMSATTAKGILRELLEEAP